MTKNPPKDSVEGEWVIRRQRKTPEFADREALREAGRRLDALMAEHKVSEEELVADFERARS